MLKILNLDNKEDKYIESKSNKSNTGFDEILNRKLKELNFLKGSKNER